MATTRRSTHKLALNQLSRSRDWTKASTLTTALALYWVIDATIFLQKPDIFEQAQFAKTTSALLVVALSIGLHTRTALMLWQNQRAALRPGLLASALGASTLIAQSLLFHRYLPLAILPLTALTPLLILRGQPPKPPNLQKHPLASLSNNPPH